MTKSDFLKLIPSVITHEAWGYGKLEIIVDSKKQKGVCYRHLDNGASYGTYAESWKELYDDLSAYLKEQGHFDNHG